jgi:rhodanese-related sulfurtransferase
MHPTDVPTVRVDELPAAAVLIADAVHVPMGRVPQQLQFDPGALTPDASIVVVCKVGSRSAHVTAWLRQHGYDAVNLEGGMFAWELAGRPMEATDGGHPHVI